MGSYKFSIHSLDGTIEKTVSQKIFHPGEKVLNLSDPSGEFTEAWQPLKTN